jgi:PAS domain S-box-containing protein
VRSAGEAEARLRGLLEGSFDGILGFDLEFRYTIWGSGMERISGVPAARVLGRVAFEVFPFLVETGEDEVFRRVLRGESVRDLERPFRVPESGREGFFEGCYYPVLAASGAITGGMAIIRDVTERKRAEAERAQLAHEVAAREAAEAARRRFAFLAEAGALLAASLDYTTTLASVAELAVPHLADWCLVHIVERDGRLREMASADVDPVKVALARQLYRGRGADDDAHAIFRVPRSGRPELVSDALGFTAVADGDLLRRLEPMSYMVVPMVARDHTLGTISFVSTVSGRRFGPADLELAQDLARRAGLAVDNARLYREVQERERSKDEFLATLGHELRNPLGAIRTASQVIDHPGTTPEEAVRQRAIVERQVAHLARLVDDLLDVARLMSGRIVLDRRPVDLNEVARQCLQAVRRDARAQEHELSLSVQAGSIAVSGDPVRLEQILFNLLDNAFKYTPAGGRVEIAVGRVGDEAVVRVRDTGIGMAPEMLPRVFDLFVQANASLARSPGGLGVGLTLVRQLVELHGGRVSAGSEGIGRGSEFLVVLPSLAPGAAATPEPVASVPSLPLVPRRVLVIEDNPDARDSLRALLEVWGHEVEVAEDGPRGFELALASQPEVVVVDIGLPGLDGYHVAQGLRTALRERGVFLVALSGYGQPEDRRRALEAGFDVHLVKPVDPQTLSGILARAPAQSAD